jgi:hypothetical protein
MDRVQEAARETRHTSAQRPSIFLCHSAWINCCLSGLPVPVARPTLAPHLVHTAGAVLVRPASNRTGSVNGLPCSSSLVMTCRTQAHVQLVVRGLVGDDQPGRLGMVWGAVGTHSEPGVPGIPWSRDVDVPAAASSWPSPGTPWTKHQEDRTREQE